MGALNDDQIRNLGQILNDPEKPLKMRFRALFALKNVKNPAALDQMVMAFKDPSALLKHEVAYCVGQMGMPEAIQVLEDVLGDVNQEAIVRHEAGEALGAIGMMTSLPVLKKHLDDPVGAVADTCHLAVERIEWLNGDAYRQEAAMLSHNPYGSVDPAPPSLNKNTQDLAADLINEDLSLFQRYRAMFALRNRGDSDSIVALTKGFGSSNALFRHEIAYVLGQIQSELSIEALKETLSNGEENEMVRHEAAEALGSVGTEAATVELNKYLDKSVPAVVRESCVVALDINEYNTSEDLQFTPASAVV